MSEASIPSSTIELRVLKEGLPAFKLFQYAGLVSSGGAARRLIEQGGAYVNGSRVASFDQMITDGDLNQDEILLRSGKKRFHKIVLDNLQGWHVESIFFCSKRSSEKDRKSSLKY